MRPLDTWMWFRALGIEPKSDEPEVFLDQKSQAWANEFLCNAKINSNLLLIGLNPGAGTTYRRWAVERFAEVGNFLQAEYKAQLLIMGGAARGRPAARIGRVNKRSNNRHY